MFMYRGRLSASVIISLLLFLLGVWADGNMGLKHHDAFASDATQTSAIDGISITPDNQILVELLPEDTAPANLFDLNERTLVFTPDGEGGYSREVRSLAWEEDIGEAVADGAVIELERFAFDFAGQSWDSFHVSRNGLLTFGGPFTYSYHESGRFETMREIATEFVNSPTISPLYAPALGGLLIDEDFSARRHVAHWPDRVVVTWAASENQFRVPGVPPSPNRFQAVLRADGSIRFNYADITAGAGIVGLFPNEVVKGDLIARVVDGTDPELPGYLDLLEVAIYASDTDAVILEFTTREPIPEPSGDTEYSYRLYFDTDQPYWTQYDFADEDFGLAINVGADGEYTTWRGEALASGADNRLALSVNIDDLLGTSAALIISSGRSNDSSFSDLSSPTQVQLSNPTPMVDLSQADSRFSRRQHEVFHYRGAPDTQEIACRVIDALGDKFDLFLFHNEFKIDNQEGGTPARGEVSRVKGIGRPLYDHSPCGDGRLLHYWGRPVRVQSFIGEYFDGDLGLFAHEFMHVWAAYLSYEKNGKREPLYDDYYDCQCHWRVALHTPAAFPWRGGDVGSIVAEDRVPTEGIFGGFWRENADGTFSPSPTNRHPFNVGGPSWLDLYVMGLADASEVPDMFILQNLKRVGEGVYTGDKEIIAIEQIIAAEGPREPSAAESQKDFNAGFVYLLEPGQTPTADLLALHAEYREKVQEYWFHITGGRSLITTNVDGNTNGKGGATLGNPRAGSFQSGVGVISGWACDAQEIIIELNGVPYRAGYPTTRTDTLERCGDTDNGFSLLWNWNNLGAGEHTVRALIDGVEFANTTVRVTTFGADPFPRGWRGTFDLPDFPTSGKTTVVQWAESLQNFVITDGQPSPGGGHDRVAGVSALLGNPSLGSAQSGVGVISGWACEAEEIVIELNGDPYRAGYPTTRPDTLERCGDTDNGFSLLWNWNNLGAGTHTVRALIDGQEFATTTVRVTTFGEDPFPRGWRGTFPIPDFPRPGENKRLRWEESLQNFVIIP